MEGGDMWAEKYRPKKLDEIVGHREFIEKLKRLIDDANSLKSGLEIAETRQLIKSMMSF